MLIPRAIVLAISLLTLLAGIPLTPAQSPIPAIAGVLEPHPPIAIVGDGGFASPLSGVRSGTGTAEDPYVISDWRLIGGHGRAAILLQDTRAHVLITHVESDDWTAEATDDPECAQNLVQFTKVCPWAIVVAQNASNVTIDGITGRLSRSPLYAVDSFDLAIRNVALTATPFFASPSIGMVLVRSHRVDASNLRLTSSVPASLNDVSHVTIRDSVLLLPEAIPVLGFAFGALVLGPTDNVTIRNNVLQGLGIQVQSAPFDLLIANNVIRGADAAIRYDVWDSDPARRSDSLSICGNFLESNGVGIDVFGVWDIDIRGNRIRNNSQAAYIAPWVGNRHVVFEGNLVHDNAAAVTIGGLGTRVGNNSFQSNLGLHRFYGDASLNWWGSAAGPRILPGENGTGDFARVNNTAGTATFTPWLTSSPARSTRCEREPLFAVPPLYETSMRIDLPGAQAAAVQALFLPGVASVRAETRYDLAGFSGAPYGWMIGSYNSSHPEHGMLGLYTLGRDDREARVDVNLLGERLELQRPTTGPNGFSMGAGAIPMWGLDSILLLAAATDPITATHLTITVWSETGVDPASVVNVRTTDRVGFATIDHFEGERTVVRVPGAAVTKMDEGWLNLTSTTGMILATDFGPDFAPAPAPGTFTIDSPERSGDASGIFDLDGLPGAYRFQVHGIDSMSPYDAPRILWADLDLRLSAP